MQKLTGRHIHNTQEQNEAFRATWDATNARYKAAENRSISWQLIIVYNDSPDKTAILNFDTYREAEENKRAFENYGKCRTVVIIQKVH